MTARRALALVAAVAGLCLTAPMAAEAAPYYKNCDAARAAGVAPIKAGEPGYRLGLDRDHDGLACEQGTGEAPAPAPRAPRVVPAGSPSQAQLPNTGPGVPTVLVASLGVVLLGGGWFTLRYGRRPGRHRP